MTTILNLPDDLMKQVELHAARAGSELNNAVADLLRIGLATSAAGGATPDAAMLERRRALI